MTEEILRTRFAEVKKCKVELIDKLFEKAIESGTIDIESYGDDSELPEVILFAILGEVKSRVRPYYLKGKRVAHDLSHIIHYY